MYMDTAGPATLMHLRHPHAAISPRRGAAVVAWYIDYRRPVRQHRDRWRGQRSEAARRVDNFTVNHGQHGLNPFDLLLRNAEVIFRQQYQIRQLADLNLPFFALLAGEPRTALRPH